MDPLCSNFHVEVGGAQRFAMASAVQGLARAAVSQARALALRSALLARASVALHRTPVASYSHSRFHRFPRSHVDHLSSTFTVDVWPSA